MFPFLTIGSVRFGTYGILLATGLFVGYLVLRAELQRRKLPANPLTIILAIGITGFVASRLYEFIETPSLFLAHPVMMLSASGFTFYGAVIGGVVAAFLLARHYAVPFLTLLDSVSTGAALGYGIGRIGCFLAGDGDYGVPTSLPWGMSFPHGVIPTLDRVHPTPLYEFLGAAIIAAYLWHRGTDSIAGRIPSGRIFAEYLLLTGVTRFLVEFIRLNPRGWLGLTNAQQVAVLSILAGLALLVGTKDGTAPSVNRST